MQIENFIEHKVRYRKMTKVAIIGAGASGLVMCHRLVHCPQYQYEVTVFEAAKDLGGTWIYSPEAGCDQYGHPIHSSMYNSLNTNLPKELMAFLDYPFKDDGSRSYIYRDAVLQYLCDYCNHFELQKYIKYSHRVEKVKPIDSNRWSIQITDWSSKKNSKYLEEFDAVVVCSGHYTTPNFPVIPGLEKFKGKIIHSHDYRVNVQFKEKNVLCVGAGSSGIDIILEVAPIANKAALSHDLPEPLKFMTAENFEVQPMIAEAHFQGFSFRNGEYFPTDALIVCTGYEYDFPFLSPECGVKIIDHRVADLYKHMINVAHPTMAFLNIPLITVPFVVGDIQAQCLANVLANPLRLPSIKEMRLDTEREMQQKLDKGILPRHFHKFRYGMWDYLRVLQETFGPIPNRLPEWKEKLYDVCFHNRSRNLVTFRKLSYRVINECISYR